MATVGKTTSQEVLKVFPTMEAKVKIFLQSAKEKYGGGKGKDTFRGVKGDGYAVIRDYIIGEDYVELEHEGSWSNTDSGLIFRDISGDQVMLLLGINDIESVSLL